MAASTTDLPEAGSGLMLNGKPVDPKTLTRDSLKDYNGVLATPEEYAAAQASANGSLGPAGMGGAYSAAQLPSASSADGYIRNWQDSALAATMQGFKTAYDTNMNTLNAAGEKIPAQYQDARNQTAAQSELGRANFNQYAADSGLNSGAGGQAQLAIGNQLQGDLSGLTKAEANAKADLELQRTQLATKYQNDIAQAIANGKLQEAQALYDNYWRQDAKLLEQKRFDATMAYQTGNDEFDKAMTLYKITGDGTLLSKWLTQGQIEELKKKDDQTQPQLTNKTDPEFVPAPYPTWSDPSLKGMVDPGLAQFLSNKLSIADQVYRLSKDNSKTIFDIIAFLQPYLYARYISLDDYNEIMSQVS